MDYKKLAKDAKVMAESFRQDGNVILPNKLEMHATAIEELLARAEKAERERDAAIEDMRGICYLCANARPYSALSKKAMTCGHRKHYGFKIHGCEHFKWRGLEE